MIFPKNIVLIKLDTYSVSQMLSLIIFPPIAILELIWIRILMIKRFEHLRTNIIAILRKNEMIETNDIEDKLTIKRILFIEENLDGTIGGSHYCLLELVRGLIKRDSAPVIIFFQNNVLVPEFKKLCPVINFP